MATFPKAFLNLSKREAQIMEVVYLNGSATAVEITQGLPDPPTHHAVRAMIRILESKGHLKHEKVGLKHVYFPTKSPESTRKSALRRVVDVFFGGSIEQTVSALISEKDASMTDEELERLLRLISKEKKRSQK